MNNRLHRLHRILFIGYISFILLFVLIEIKLFLIGPHNENGLGLGFIAFVSVFVLPLAAIHYYAAKGAKAGKGWGRDLSRLIATIMLFGIPIGTMIGIYIFQQTGKKWQAENSPVPVFEEIGRPTFAQKQRGAMNDNVKIALIIAGAMIICVGLWIYFSPYHSCVRSGGVNFLCAGGSWKSGS